MNHIKTYYNRVGVSHICPCGSCFTGSGADSMNFLARHALCNKWVEERQYSNNN